MVDSYRYQLSIHTVFVRFGSVVSEKFNFQFFILSSILTLPNFFENNSFSSCFARFCRFLVDPHTSRPQNLKKKENIRIHFFNSYYVTHLFLRKFRNAISSPFLLVDTAFWYQKIPLVIPHPLVPLSFRSVSGKPKKIALPPTLPLLTK